MNQEPNIIEEFMASDLEGHRKYKVKKTDLTKVKKMFTFIPLWLNKFSWLQHIEVLERMYIVSKEDYDGGITYQTYWTKPEEEWRKETIL